MVEEEVSICHHLTLVRGHLWTSTICFHFRLLQTTREDSHQLVPGVSVPSWSLLLGLGRLGLLNLWASRLGRPDRPSMTSTYTKELNMIKHVHV